jgi:hypothetical protein
MNTQALNQGHKSRLQRRLELYDMKAMSTEDINDMKKEFALDQIKEAMDTLKEVYASSHGLHPRDGDIRIRSQLSIYAPGMDRFDAMDEVHVPGLTLKRTSKL